jgi:hypothetical protein
MLRRVVIASMMIRPAVVALALCVVSAAQSMPYAPLQQPNSWVTPVRQGCGLGRQLVDGICVSNAKVRAAVRKCDARKMRMVNGRCEPRTRPAAARPAATPPAAAALPLRQLRASNPLLLLPRLVDRRTQARTNSIG